MQASPVVPEPLNGSRFEIYFFKTFWPLSFPEFVGYKYHTELLRHLESIGQDPPVLDSKQILLNPKKVLGELCERIRIPFQEAMLSWKADARPKDGSWAKYWYKSVHQSTGFGTYIQKSEPFPEALKLLLEECKPYYQQLSAVAIKA